VAAIRFNVVPETTDQPSAHPARGVALYGKGGFGLMDDPAPNPNWTGRVAMAPHVALDEAILAVIRSRQPKLPTQATADRTVTEMATMSELFDGRGWLAAPATYHRKPPALRDADILELRARSRPLRHETITFPSGFLPRAIEPGAERWAGNGRTDIVFVRLLRHHQTTAPWVICLHGFGMGSSRFDLSVLWATYLHSKLGFNVAVPVSPLHGPRRAAGDAQLLSLDLASTLHGITQAVWDVRRLASWLRSTGDAPVGVYGLSLGGYLASLLAGIERFDAVVAALPFADVLGLMAHHGPPLSYLNVMRSDPAQNAFRVISPLAMNAQLPPDRLALFAARADRLIPTDQTFALADTWQSPHVHWSGSGHVGFTWSREAKRLVGDRLGAALHVPVEP
jgi:pimeloyl-ACP methyl ester carboxylesterase